MIMGKQMSSYGENITWLNQPTGKELVTGVSHKRE
jgi:hypothetical protein